MTLFVLKRHYKVLGFTVLFISIIIMLLFVILLKDQLFPFSALTAIYVFLLSCVIYCAIKIIRENIGGIWTHKFNINEHGVTYQKKHLSYHLRWCDVNRIEIIPKYQPRGLVKLKKSSMICFNGNDMIDGSGKDIESFDSLFFGVQYRDCIIKEIRKYSELPIKGIFHVTGKSIH